MCFNLRYTQFYRKLHQLVAEGAIGDIISMEFNETIKFTHGGMIMGNWRRLQKNAGTHMLEKCCHDMDLATWIVDSPAARVASFGGLDFFIPRNRWHQERLGKNERGIPAYGVSLNPNAPNPFTAKKDIVDNQVVIIEYANGVRATFHANMNSGIPERRMYLVGTEGAIRADLRKLTIEVGRVGFHEKVKKFKTRPQTGHGGGDAVMACELGKSMLTGEPLKTGFDDGLKSAIICFAIDQAMESGKVVSLARYWRRADLGWRRSRMKRGLESHEEQNH
jgi:predicted dehydrogenase